MISSQCCQLFDSQIVIDPDLVPRVDNTAVLDKRKTPACILCAANYALGPANHFSVIIEMLMRPSEPFFSTSSVIVR